MIIDLLGASNIALSLYKDITGIYRVSTAVNVATMLSENTDFVVRSYVGLTIAQNNINETSYLDYIDVLQGGDVLFVQGAGNDYGAYIETGDIDSFECNTYYGALNHIIQSLINKYKFIILATGFGVKKNSAYKEYNKAIKAVADKYNLFVIDFENDERFNEKNTLPDKEHMNESGLKLYTDIVTEVLIKLVADK